MKDADFSNNFHDAEPVEWIELSDDEVYEHRQLDCLNYNRCLTKAALHRWISFTCKFCKYFEGHN